MYVLAHLQRQLHCLSPPLQCQAALAYLEMSLLPCRCTLQVCSAHIHVPAPQLSAGSGICSLCSTILKQTSCISPCLSFGQTMMLLWVCRHLSPLHLAGHQVWVMSTSFLTSIAWVLWSCWAQPEHRQGLRLFWARDFFGTLLMILSSLLCP